MVTVKFGTKLIPDIFSSRFVDFEVHDAGGRIGQLVVEVAPMTAIHVRNELGLGEDEGDAAILDAMARIGAQRAKEMLADPRTRDELAEAGEIRWRLGNDDIDDILGLINDKTCSYQTTRGRDLYCSAAAQNDDTVVGIDGLARLAPTSAQLCRRCGIPDGRYLCSHLTHPDVRGVTGGAGLIKRAFLGGLCDLGNSEVNQHPDGCHAGGHPCWEQVIDVTVASVVPVPPLAVADALDAFEAVWRLVVGAGEDVIKLGSLADLAALDQPVVDRETFQVRVDQLADILARFNVPDELLPPGTPKQHRHGSLNRLQTVLAKLANNPDRAGADVAPLRHISGLRNGLTHKDQSKIRSRSEALGIEWPPTDWARAWDRVRLAAIDALRDVRRTLQGIASDEGGPTPQSPADSQ